MATYRILSIDGGGIRGVIPAVWLTRLADAMEVAAPAKSLLQHFDLLAGTSTGSIIAAGLAVGKSPDQILKLYIEKGRKIFPASPFCNPKRHLGGALLPAYSDRGLDKVLKEEFGNKKLGEVSKVGKRLLIVVFNGSTRRLRVFDSHDPNDHDYLLRDLLRASCAAPTYLPAKELEIDGLPGKQTLLDGGVTANNPAALALSTAFALGKTGPQIVLVSLGTGVASQRITAAQGTRRGWMQWAKPIVDVMFDGSSSSNEYLVEQLLPVSSNFRFQKYGLGCDPSLDRSDEDHLKDLQEEANRYWTDEAVKVKQVVAALCATGPLPALPLGGRWQSAYNWVEQGQDYRSDWPEVVALNVNGSEVTGSTTAEPPSRYPFEVTARIVGQDLIGETASKDRTPQKHCAFVLRLYSDEVHELRGHWVGTGDFMRTGDWTLKKLSD